MICILTYQSLPLFAEKQKNHSGYAPIAKIGEAICKNQLVNFLKEKEHKTYTCSSVYYDAVS